MLRSTTQPSQIPPNYAIPTDLTGFVGTYCGTVIRSNGKPSIIINPPKAEACFLKAYEQGKTAILLFDRGESEGYIHYDFRHGSKLNERM